MAKKKDNGKAKKAAPARARPAQAAESAQGATGREMAVERQGEEGRLKGLNRYPPGSNGGVRRGPDRYPRVNVAGAMLMKFYMRDGRLLVLQDNGRLTHKKGKVPAAAVENMVTRLVRIVDHGSDADVLRLLSTTEVAFRPLKNGNGHGSGTPTAPVFIRPPQEPPGPEPPTPDGGSRGGLRDADGKEYVET